MIRKFCDYCGSEIDGDLQLNGGAHHDRLVGVAGPAEAPLEVEVLLRRRHGVEMCRACLVGFIVQWAITDQSRQKTTSVKSRPDA